jgi:hypothetical protein
VRGIYEGHSWPISGVTVKGRVEDFRSIAKYRFYACVFPNVEPEASKNVGNGNNPAQLVLVPKLVSPAEAAGERSNPSPSAVLIGSRPRSTSRDIIVK